jgi:hypothetical protein
MTSSKAAGKAALTLASSVKPRNEEPKAASAGWDPFEVWRTRVLLPRLEEKQLATADQPAADPRLVRSA